MELESVSQNRWRGRFFRYAPFLLWTAVILFMSTSQASMSETSRFIRPALEFLFPYTSEQTLLIYHSYIRKSAHLCEYAVLGFLASRAFWNSSYRLLRRYWFIFAIGAVLLIASTDEINQSFNLTRTGSIYDVVLDGIGGLVTIVFLAIFKKVRNN